MEMFTVLGRCWQIHRPRQGFIWITLRAFWIGC